MSAVDLRNLIENFSPPEYKLFYKKCLLLAKRLLARHGHNGSGVDAEDIVQENFMRITSEHDGYVSPPGFPIQKFIVLKMQSTVDYFVSQTRRRAKRAAAACDASFYATRTSLGVDVQREDLKLHELIEEGTALFNDRLAQSRHTDAFRSYVAAIPHIIAEGLDDREIAKIIEVKAASVSAYRARLKKFIR